VHQSIEEKLTGEEIVQFVGISDGYGAYTNAFAVHQLCWAHPHRKLRDLTESKALEIEPLKRCKETYEQFATLYTRVRDEIKKETEQPTSEIQREQLKEELMKQLECITQLHPDDPKKLITYKTTLWKYREKYFVCILNP
jgi:hypothetical protein